MALCLLVPQPKNKHYAFICRLFIQEFFFPTFLSNGEKRCDKHRVARTNEKRQESVITKSRFLCIVVILNIFSTLFLLLLLSLLPYLSLSLYYYSFFSLSSLDLNTASSILFVGFYAWMVGRDGWRAKFICVNLLSGRTLITVRLTTTTAAATTIRDAIFGLIRIFCMSLRRIHKIA